MADAVAAALFEEVITKSTVPGGLTTDRGTEFTNAVLAHLCQRLNIKQFHTTAFHPESDGKCERSHFEVVQVINSVNYAVRKSARAKSFIVHANRLRPFFGAVDAEASKPADQPTPALPAGQQFHLVPETAAVMDSNTQQAAESVSLDTQSGDTLISTTTQPAA